MSFFQSGRGKVSLEEFRALANRDITTERQQEQHHIQQTQEHLDDDIFSIEDFEETEQISIK